MNREILLGVNIDHVATLRQARKTKYPDPLMAVYAAELGGADKITLHLREDRRHIQPQDVIDIKEKMQVPMNLELALTQEMLDFAEEVKPEYVCFVPEKREEITTEGGLDVLANFDKAQSAVARLESLDIEVSIFIDPIDKQIKAAHKIGASAIELHTGSYADSTSKNERCTELARISDAAKYAASLNLIVNAGHGLHYHNVKPIIGIKEIVELNIGHAIIARAIFCGMERAVREMKMLINGAGA